MPSLPWKPSCQLDARELDGGDRIRGEYFGARFSGVVQAVIPVTNDITEVHVHFDTALRVAGRRIESACLFVDMSGRMLSGDGVLLGAVHERIGTPAQP